MNSIQLLSCSSGSGYFTLFFNGDETKIPFDSTLEMFEKSLEALPTIGDLLITFSTGTTVCNSITPNIVSIEFLNNFGEYVQQKLVGLIQIHHYSRLPPLKVYSSYNDVHTLGGGVLVAHSGSGIHPSVSILGTKENTPCNNRGTCDYSK